MINFRSYIDLYETIKNKIDKIPKDIDLIVGIPRSGMLVSNIIALTLNKPLVDLEGFLEKKIFSSGQRLSNGISSFSKIKKILVIDDSLCSGLSLEKSKFQINKSGIDKEIIYGVVYLKPGQENKVDLYLELCPLPRIFEWNLFHHQTISRSCIDIDGILCRDPTEEENDDGEKYIFFINNVKPKIIPTMEISHLVTCRLEKYRKDTVNWLKKNSIKYKNLIMMPYNTKSERIASGSHSNYKAQRYIESKTDLFIESDIKQAEEIFNLTLKDVYSFGNSTMLSTDLIKIEKNNFFTNKDTTTKINSFLRENKNLTDQCHNYELEINGYQDIIGKLKQDLYKIQSSKTYKIWQKYNKIKHILKP